MPPAYSPWARPATIRGYSSSSRNSAATSRWTGSTSRPVLDACAASGPGREDSWINAPIRRLYIELNARGQAHSIECWRDETLVGGLYGVTLGGAFFGESMFSRERDASKIALVHLVARLKRGGWGLLDTQFLTGHLSQFGATETPQATYLELLRAACTRRPNPRSMFNAMTGSEALFYALQPTIQAS